MLQFTVQDSLESIFETLKKVVLAHRNGEVVSINFSKIRPRGDIISSTQKPSEGAAAFLQIFDRTLNIIQSRTLKKSSHVALIRVDHPDILEFLSCQTSFNINIAVGKTFTQAVQNETMYDLVDPHTRQKSNELDAQNVYNLISEKVSRDNESGIIYIESRTPQTINKPTKKNNVNEAQSSLFGEENSLPTEVALEKEITPLPPLPLPKATFSGAEEVALPPITQVA